MVTEIQEMTFQNVSDIASLKNDMITLEKSKSSAHKAENEGVDLEWHG